MISSWTFSFHLLGSIIKMYTKIIFSNNKTLYSPILFGFSGEFGDKDEFLTHEDQKKN